MNRAHNGLKQACIDLRAQDVSSGSEDATPKARIEAAVKSGGILNLYFRMDYGSREAMIEAGKKRNDLREVVASKLAREVMPK
jgi:hypothetical protein